MAETAELLQGLTDLRLPDPGMAELALTLGAGILLTVALGLVLRLFRRRPRRVRISDRIDGTQRLESADRFAALAALLRDLTDLAAPGDDPWAERAARTFGLDAQTTRTLREGLYHPGPTPDPAALEAIVRRAARRVPGSSKTV